MRSAKAIERELTAIERSLWANNAGIYEATYLPDAVLIFPEVGRIDRTPRSQRFEKRTRPIDGGRWWTSPGYAPCCCRPTSRS